MALKTVAGAGAADAGSADAPHTHFQSHEYLVLIAFSGDHERPVCLSRKRQSREAVGNRAFELRGLRPSSERGCQEAANSWILAQPDCFLQSLLGQCQLTCARPCARQRHPVGLVTADLGRYQARQHL